MGMFRKSTTVQSLPASQPVQPLHPFKRVAKTLMLEFQKLLAAGKLQTLTGTSASLVSVALPSAVKLVSNSLTEMDDATCDEFCDFLNKLNAKLCSERGVAVEIAVSSENGPSVIRGTNGEWKDDTRALHAGVP